MNPASKSRTGGREPDAGKGEVDSKNKETPAPDMQPEDTGTAASGNEGEAAAQQTSKTGQESGEKR